MTSPGLREALYHSGLWIHNVWVYWLTGLWIDGTMGSLVHGSTGLPTYAFTGLRIHRAATVHALRFRMTSQRRGDAPGFMRIP